MTVTINPRMKYIKAQTIVLVYSLSLSAILIPHTFKTPSAIVKICPIPLAEVQVIQIARTGRYLKFNITNFTTKRTAIGSTRARLRLSWSDFNLPHVFSALSPLHQHVAIDRRALFRTLRRPFCHSCWAGGWHTYRILIHARAWRLVCAVVAGPSRWMWPTIHLGELKSKFAAGAQRRSVAIGVSIIDECVIYPLVDLDARTETHRNNKHFTQSGDSQYQHQIVYIRHIQSESRNGISSTIARIALFRQTLWECKVGNQQDILRGGKKYFVCVIWSTPVTGIG